MEGEEEVALRKPTAVKFRPRVVVKHVSVHGHTHAELPLMFVRARGHMCHSRKVVVGSLGLSSNRTHLCFQPTLLYGHDW